MIYTGYLEEKADRLQRAITRLSTRKNPNIQLEDLHEIRDLLKRLDMESSMLLDMTVRHEMPLDMTVRTVTDEKASTQ